MRLDELEEIDINREWDPEDTEGRIRSKAKGRASAERDWSRYRKDLQHRISRLLHKIERRELSSTDDGELSGGTRSRLADVGQRAVDLRNKITGKPDDQTDLRALKEESESTWGDLLRDFRACSETDSSGRGDSTSQPLNDREVRREFRSPRLGPKR